MFRKFLKILNALSAANMAVVVMALCMFAMQLNCLSERLTEHSHVPLQHHHHDYNGKHSHDLPAHDLPAHGLPDSTPDTGESCCQTMFGILSFKLSKALQLAYEFQLESKFLITNIVSDFYLSNSRLNLIGYHPPPNINIFHLLFKSLSVVPNAPPLF